MRLARATLMLMLLFVAAAGQLQAQDATSPKCGGKDLLKEIAEKDPDALQRIDAAASQIPNGEAMLWKIAAEGSSPSYLFGTIHVSDPRVTTLPPKVARALASSKTVALEIADLSPKAFEAAFSRAPDLIVFKDGRNLADVLTEGELEAARALAGQNGMPAELAPLLKPWVLMSLLSVPGCERRRVEAGAAVLDQELGVRHRKRGLPVRGLEKIDEQLQAMARIPEPDQVIVLKAGLKTMSRAEDLFETILQRYLAREIAKVWPMQLEMARAAGFDPVHFQSFRTEIISKRNLKMRDQALPLIRGGKAFIAVGALHLVGDDGLVALFRRAGLDVSAAE